MNIFNFIKSNIAILEVIQQYVTLKKAGGIYWKGQCPFHNERTGSFTVSPDKGIFYCFGCQETGDVISFIEKIEQLSTFEACTHLAEQFQLTIPEEYLKQEKKHGPTASEKKDFYEICKYIATWCNKQLQNNSAAKNYLLKRSFTQRDITSFTLGYFPKGASKDFLHFLAQHGLNQEHAKKVGVLFENKYGNVYSPYEGRIIFPIFEHLGRCCGFGGRVFLPQDDRPKYYNSKESNFFQKSQLLFGFNKAKQSIQQKKSALLVEGYTDCIALHSKGYTNTIATLGTACTLQHLQQIARHAQDLFVLYDADTAGVNAILRLTQLCWQVDITIHVIPMPKQYDPASYIQDHNTLDELFTQKMDIFTYFFTHMHTGYQTASMGQKLHIAQDILHIIGNLQDPIKKDLLLVQASQMLQVPVQTLHKEIIKLKSKKPIAMQQKQKIEPKDSYPYNSLPALDKKIGSLLVHNPELLQKEDYLLLEYLSEPLHTIFKTYYAQTNKQDFWNTYRLTLSTEQQNLLQTLYFTIDDENTTISFQYVVQQFLQKHWKSIAANIKLQLQKASPEKQKELLQTFTKLQSKFLNHRRV